MGESISNILIIAITPPILERGLIWFQKNQQRIERASNLFWQRNTLSICENQKVMMSEIMRKLTDFGYQKYQSVELPGEFSQNGGILIIFPINSRWAVKIEFSGNTVESIIETSKENAKPEKLLKELLYPNGTRRKEMQNDLSGLKQGDYVVHIDHGVGMLKSQITIRQLADKSQTNSNSQNSKIENFYILDYAGGDILRVPEEVSYKLSPYIGFSTPTIYRLGGNLWHKIKRKVNENIIKTAKQLLAIYAAREIAERVPYSNEPDMLFDIKKSFDFDETEDQKRVIEEIMNDMDKTTPMDRIVCGDVGFGKTEVAIRAAARALFSGKQVAMIAPTTVLAWQHFQTFKSRFEKIPVTIELLTRIQKENEQKNIVIGLKEGKIDLILGTHRLLQKDIEFKNLGLLVIDEEQRFGVKQKEKLKILRADLDILSLSATPIPRTLYLSLSGLKNISNIKTPPLNRLPIKTYVSPRSKKLIKTAIERELERGGQIYYLHNRISTIDTAYMKVRELAGSAKILVGHAKLPENQLIEIFDDFKNKKADILIATTIIENGLDLSNVNTLIVEDATRLGLSQAHQIRGRIGRSARQAYAYFLYSPKKLTDVGKKRLQILEEFQNLGEGYKIAMRDLEIRGAGNILGREQHGSINKVGLNLYCQMLNEAVEQLKSNRV